MFRHIDKVGGLDNYILTVPEKKQKSDLAQELRHKIEAALQKPLRDALMANSEVLQPLWLPSHACCCFLAFLVSAAHPSQGCKEAIVLHILCKLS